MWLDYGRQVACWVTSVVLAVLSVGCAIPGSSGGHYTLRGELIDRETKKGIPGRQIKTIFPGSQGLSASESSMPEVFGASGQSFDLQTDVRGQFGSEAESIYHVSFMLLPPLGWIPRRAPQPFYIIQIEKPCWRRWGIDFSQTPPDVRMWDPQTGEFVKTDAIVDRDIIAENDLAQCTKENADDCKRKVISKLQLFWNDQASCVGQPSETPATVAPILPKTGLAFSYGDVFSRSVGVNFSRRFFGSGFLRVDVPIGTYKSSYGVGAILNLRFLSIHRVGLQVGGGAEWMQVRAADLHYPEDKNGVHAVFHAGFEARVWRQLHLESGYTSTTIGQYQHDDRVYARLGWFF